MARLRKFVAYRRLERPYTRTSKYRKKSFVRARPNINLVKYDMGDKTRKFSYYVDLSVKEGIQIRHNALESARQVTNRLMEKVVGKGGFYFKIRTYPHHILRENPLAKGAGADRMSTGMTKAFGKAIGTAVRLRKNQKLLTIGVEKNGIPTAREALRRASSKLPCGCSITVREAAAVKA